LATSRSSPISGLLADYSNSGGEGSGTGVLAPWRGWKGGSGTKKTGTARPLIRQTPS